MTIQLGICVRFVSVLILLPAFSTRARSLAAIDESVTQSKIRWNSADQKPRQTEARNLEEFERRAPIESTGRSVFGRIRHYVGTHKELLASDALIFAAWSADAVSSIQCQHAAFPPDETCTEANNLLGAHPSELTYWGYFAGLETIFITANHLWWHRHPGSPWHHLVWAIPIACSIDEFFNVQNNLAFPPKPTNNAPKMTGILSQQPPATAMERLREARARLAP
jgi:hypothetical protein